MITHGMPAAAAPAASTSARSPTTSTSRRVDLPAAAGARKPARVRLEHADLRVGGAQHHREAAGNAERLQLALRRIIREARRSRFPARSGNRATASSPAARQRARYFSGRSIIHSLTIASTSIDGQTGASARPVRAVSTAPPLDLAAAERLLRLAVRGERRAS